MARVPFAAWHRCPGSEPSIRPTQVIFHTAVVRDLEDLENYFCSGRSGGIESHLGVGGKWGRTQAQDGAVYQWRDTQEQADANRTANRRPDGTGAISVETCDNVPASSADILPWTDKQVDTLVRIGRWARVHHNIPPRICRNPDDPGFGWHAMWLNTQYEYSDGSTPWTPSAGKVCPGSARIHQLKTVVLPRIFASLMEDEMTKDEFVAALGSAEFNTAVQNAVQEALVAKAASGHVFVTANDDRGVFVVTPLGLLHVDSPSAFSVLSGGKPLGAPGAALVVTPQWLTNHMAVEG